jgi:hypothetical protein
VLTHSYQLTAKRETVRLAAGSIRQAADLRRDPGAAFRPPSASRLRVVRR